MRRPALKLLVLALAALALPATSAFAQSAYKPEYKLSTVVGPAFPWGKGGEIWADLVRERGRGRQRQRDERESECLEGGTAHGVSLLEGVQGLPGIAGRARSVSDSSLRRMAPGVRRASASRVAA